MRFTDFISDSIEPIKEEDSNSKECDEKQPKFLDFIKDTQRLSKTDNSK